MTKKRKSGVDNPNIPKDWTEVDPKQFHETLITLDDLNPAEGMTHRQKRKFGKDIHEYLDQVHTIAKETEKRERVARRVKKARRDGVVKAAMAQAKESLLAELDTKTIIRQTVEEVTSGTLIPTKDDRSGNTILFEPNPGPQTEFLASAEQEVLYGGARGGGKTYAMIFAPLRYCSSPHMRGLIIRRSMPELRDIIYKAQAFYEKAYPGTKWRVKENTFFFPSGARIEFGYAATRDDWNRYIGQSYTWIGIDEAGHFADLEEMLDALRSCLRSVDPDSAPPQLRLTSNPGAISSDVLKKQFVNKAPPNVTFFDDVEMPDNTIERISRKFIPAKVTDNPHLMKDKSYLKMLASLSPVKRQQWLDGNWDVFEGAAFPEFDRGHHVVKPFAIPPEWRRVRGMDWGYTTPGCCLWGAFDPRGNLFIYREFYFQEIDAHRVGQRIRDMEMAERVFFGVLDVQVWEGRGGGGPSIGESLNSYNLRFRKSSRSFVNGKSSRINGRAQVHNLLALDEHTQKPKLVIFENCLNLIRTLPALPVCPSNPEDVDTKAEDHAYDALRYLIQSRAVPVSDWRADTWLHPEDRAPIQNYVIHDEILGF